MKLHEILPIEIAALQLIEASKEDKNIIAKMRYNFINGDKNGNGRTYDPTLIKREIKSMTQRLETQKIASTLDHPTTIVPELQKVSHLITKVVWDEEKKAGVAESSILQTTAGKNLKILIDNGVKLGASIRGSGSVDSLGNVQDNWKLEGIDLVSNPSFGDLTDVSSANLIESGNKVLQPQVIGPLMSRHTMTAEQLLFEKWDFALTAGYKGSLDDFKKQMKVVKLKEKKEELKNMTVEQKKAKIKFHHIMAENMINEEFFSLEKSLRSAISDAYGDRNYIIDFSDKEVIYHSTEEGLGDDYSKIAYEIKDGEIKLTGTAQLVSKTVDYKP